MPLLRDYQQVKDVYQEAGELGVGLPVFCAEDRDAVSQSIDQTDASVHFPQEGSSGVGG